MSRKLLLVVIIMVLACTVGCEQSSQVIMIKAGTLIDGTGGPPQHHVVITIRDGLIDSIQSGSVPRFTRATVIDATDAVVLPGFIDAHLYVEFWADDGGTVWTRQGVTTVADLGASIARLERYQQQFNQDLSPRLLATGPTLSVPDVFSPMSFWGEEFSLLFNGAEDARVQAEKLIRDHGVQLLMVNLWGISKEEVAAIMEVGHHHNVPVIGLGTRDEHWQPGLAGGIRVLATAPENNISDELLQLAADLDVIVISTVRQFSSWDTGESLRRFYDLGGTIALGSAAGYALRYPGMPMYELEELRDVVGMDVLDIITAATSNAAKALGIIDRLGTVEAGKIADLLIVGGDPLTDLDALLDVQVVIRDGVVVHKAQ